MVARESQLQASKTIAVVRALALKRAEYRAISSHHLVEDASRATVQATTILRAAEAAWQNAVRSSKRFDPFIADLCGGDVMRRVSGSADAQNTLDKRQAHADEDDDLWRNALAQDRLAADHVRAEQRRAMLQKEARQMLDLDDVWRVLRRSRAPPDSGRVPLGQRRSPRPTPFPR